MFRNQNTNNGVRNYVRVACVALGLVLVTGRAARADLLDNIMDRATQARDKAQAAKESAAEIRNRIRDAAENLADVLLTEGVDLLKRPKTDLMLHGGFVVDKKRPDIGFPFSQIASRTARRGIPLRWQGYFDPVKGHRRIIVFFPEVKPITGRTGKN